MNSCSLKSTLSTHCQEDDVGRLHGVVWRHDDPAVVDTAIKFRVCRAPDSEVPLKQVVLEGLGIVLLSGLSQLLCFPEQPLHSCQGDVTGLLRCTVC